MIDFTLSIQQQLTTAFSHRHIHLCEIRILNYADMQMKRLQTHYFLNSLVYI